MALLMRTRRHSPAVPNRWCSSNRNGSPPWLQPSNWGGSRRPKVARWSLCSARNDGNPGSAVSNRAMQRRCGCALMYSACMQAGC